MNLSPSAEIARWWKIHRTKPLDRDQLEQVVADLHDGTTLKQWKDAILETSTGYGGFGKVRATVLAARRDGGSVAGSYTPEQLEDAARRHWRAEFTDHQIREQQAADRELDPFTGPLRTIATWDEHGIELDCGHLADDRPELEHMTRRRCPRCEWLPTPEHLDQVERMLAGQDRRRRRGFRGRLFGG